MKIAHIIHPVVVDRSSDLNIAQPITFETMRIARDHTKKEDKDIALHAIQYRDEKQISLPECFGRTADLERSVFDIKNFRKKRKLALIGDILDKLYDASPDADYMIYTNVDIALQPYFYTSVMEIINMGYDSFVINRRTIPGRYQHIGDIPMMYTEIGISHKGYDCFVFKREMYPKFILGDICIGTAWIGRTLLANMVMLGNKFKEFRDRHITFHIGDTLSWRNEEYRDYFLHNREEYQKIFAHLESSHGSLESIWHSYLMDLGEKRQFPEFDGSPEKEDKFQV